MNEQNISQVLNTKGAHIKVLRAALAGLELELETEITELQSTFANYKLQENALPIQDLNLDVEVKKLLDKRRQKNPIKDLNIGVRRSYEWKIRDGFTADDARTAVYESILEIAVNKGIIKFGDNLPDVVAQKIEDSYSNYETIKVKVLSEKTVKTQEETSDSSSNVEDLNLDKNVLSQDASL